jgi:hypothetical protein
VAIPIQSPSGPTAGAVHLLVPEEGVVTQGSVIATILP